MKLKAPFFLWLAFVFLITNLLHEAGHWLMGAALGMDMKFGLNGVKYLSATTDWQRALADGAGPLVTIVQAIVAYVVVRRSASLKAFAFLYAAAFMRMWRAWSASCIRTTKRGSVCISAWASGPCRCWWRWR